MAFIKPQLFSLLREHLQTSRHWRHLFLPPDCMAYEQNETNENSSLSIIFTNTPPTAQPDTSYYSCLKRMAGVEDKYTNEIVFSMV